MKSDKGNNKFEELDFLLQSALEFDSDDAKLQFEAEMLHLNTMSLIAKLMEERKMNKKDLAKELNTSASFITQLFTADKLINYKILAKLQRIFKVNFDVSIQEWANEEAEIISEFQNRSTKIIPLQNYIKSKEEKEYTLYMTKNKQKEFPEMSLCS